MSDSCGCVFVIVWWFMLSFFFFFKQKTAYEMRISDWSSDVCSSDLAPAGLLLLRQATAVRLPWMRGSSLRMTAGVWLGRRTLSSRHPRPLSRGSIEPPLRAHHVTPPQPTRTASEACAAAG